MVYDIFIINDEERGRSFCGKVQKMKRMEHHGISPVQNSGRTCASGILNWGYPVVLHPFHFLNFAAKRSAPLFIIDDEDVVNHRHVKEISYMDFLTPTRRQSRNFGADIFSWVMWPRCVCITWNILHVHVTSSNSRKAYYPQQL